MTTRFLIGTVVDQLATLADDSVDLVATSPPFLALRSYLPADHPTKTKEIGSEATPADFLDTMLDVVEACDRVLAPHGSLCFEIGDTYSGSGGAGGDYGTGGLREGQPRFRAGYLRNDGRKNGQAAATGEHAYPVTGRGGAGWPLDKSLTGLPTLFAWSLAYGRNLLRPERETPPWRIRNVISWGRPNPPVGALGDKARPATSYITVATKSRTRYWDMDAVRVPVRHPGKSATSTTKAPGGQRFGSHTSDAGSTAPLLDHWTVPTQPYSGAHFATLAEEIPRRLILLMCPELVCMTCGEPKRRIVEATGDAPTRVISAHTEQTERSRMNEWQANRAPGQYQMPRDREGERAVARSVVTLGWTDCGHGTYRRGVVLDPFGGSGTTGAVAAQLGRDAVLIDLDARNADLARQRIAGVGLLQVTEADGREREVIGQEAML